MSQNILHIFPFQNILHLFLQPHANRDHVNWKKGVELQKFSQLVFPPFGPFFVIRGVGSSSPRTETLFFKDFILRIKSVYFRKKRMRNGKTHRQIYVVYNVCHEKGSDQLIVPLYTLSIYLSVHNQLIRTLFEAHIVTSTRIFPLANICTCLGTGQPGIPARSATTGGQTTYPPLSWTSERWFFSFFNSLNINFPSKCSPLEKSL